MADMQRGRVDAAEAAMPETDPFRSLHEVRDFVAGVTGSRWWRDRGWPERVRVDFTSPKLSPRRARGGTTPQRGWYVRFPGYTDPTTENPWRVCHELAHVATLSDGGGVDHGPAFCERYLDLVDRFVGASCAQHLGERFLEAGVAFLPVERVA